MAKAEFIIFANSQVFENRNVMNRQYRFDAALFLQLIADWENFRYMCCVFFL